MSGNGTRKFHYAWIIMIACCFISTASIGVFASSMGVFMTPVSQELGVSGSTFTLSTMTVAGLVMGLLSPVAAKVIKKKNINLVAGGCFVIMSLALLAMSQFHHLYQFVLANVVVGIGASVVFYVLTPVLIGNWFKKKMGLALGIALGFSGVGGMILNPLGAYCIANYSWRTAYIVFAVVVAILGIPAAGFVIRRSPSDKGLQPYGSDSEDVVATQSTATTVVTGVPKAIAVKSPAFFCMILTAILMLLLSSFYYHMPSYAPTVGLTAVFGATMVSYVMFTNLICKFVLGGVCDKLGSKRVTTMVLVVVGVAFALLYLAGNSKSMNLAGAFLYGVIVPSSSMFMPLIIREIFGNRDYGEIYSYIVLVNSVAGAFGVTFVGVLHDATGGYSIPFLIGLAMVVIALVLIHLAFTNGKHLADIKNSPESSDVLIAKYKQAR